MVDSAGLAVDGEGLAVDGGGIVHGDGLVADGLGLVVSGCFCLVGEAEFPGVPSFRFVPLELAVNHSPLLDLVASAGRRGTNDLDPIPFLLFEQ